MSLPPRLPQTGTGGNGVPTSKRNYEQYERDLDHEDGEPGDSERTKRQRAGNSNGAEQAGPSTAGTPGLVGASGSGTSRQSAVQDIDRPSGLELSPSIPSGATAPDLDGIRAPIPPAGRGAPDASSRGEFLRASLERSAVFDEQIAVLRDTHQTPGVRALFARGPSAPQNDSDGLSSPGEHIVAVPSASPVPTFHGVGTSESANEAPSLRQNSPSPQPSQVHSPPHSRDDAWNRYQAHVSAATEHLHSAMELLRRPSSPFSVRLPGQSVTEEQVDASRVDRTLPLPQRHSSFPTGHENLDRVAGPSTSRLHRRAGSSSRANTVTDEISVGPIERRPWRNSYSDLSVTGVARANSVLPPPSEDTGRATPPILRSWFSNPAPFSVRRDSGRDTHQTNTRPPSRSREDGYGGFFGGGRPDERNDRYPSMRSALERERGTAAGIGIAGGISSGSLDLPPLSLPPRRPSIQLPTLRSQTDPRESLTSSATLRRRQLIRAFELGHAADDDDDVVRGISPRSISSRLERPRDDIDDDDDSLRLDRGQLSEGRGAAHVHYRQRAEHNLSLLLDDLNRSRAELDNMRGTLSSLSSDSNRPSRRGRPGSESPTQIFDPHSNVALELRQQRFRSTIRDVHRRRPSPFQRFGASAPDGLEDEPRQNETSRTAGEDIFHSDDFDLNTRPPLVESPLSMTPSASWYPAPPVPPRSLSTHSDGVRSRLDLPPLPTLVEPSRASSEASRAGRRWLDDDDDDYLSARSAFRSFFDDEESHVFRRSPSPMPADQLRQSRLPPMPRVGAAALGRPQPEASSSAVSANSTASLSTAPSALRRRAGERAPIDLSVFHDGPFRATLARQHGGERPAPPESYARVSLDDDDDNQRPTRYLPREPVRRPEISPFLWEPRREMPPSLASRLSNPMAGNVPSSSSNSSGDGQTRQRDQRDLQSSLRRRLRVEASDIAGGPAGRDAGFNRAIDALRADGLSSHRERQLVERYHRERDQADERAGRGETSLPHWGDLIDARREPSIPPPPQRRSTLTRPTRRGFFSASSEELLPPPPPAPRRWLRRTATRDTETGHSRDDDFPPSVQQALARRRERFMRDHESLLNARGIINFFHRGGQGAGDYIRDEDFDPSYEGLLRLAERLGDVRPRVTSEEIIASLPHGTFGEWVSEGCDHRCPICLEDYLAEDPLLKLPECAHWLHRDCLQQWLRNARSCPVCRKDVQPPPASRTRTPAPEQDPRNDDDEQDLLPDGLNNSSTEFDSSAGPRFG